MRKRGARSEEKERGASQEFGIAAQRSAVQRSAEQARGDGRYHHFRLELDVGAAWHRLRLLEALIVHDLRQRHTLRRGDRTAEFSEVGFHPPEEFEVRLADLAPLKPELGDVFVLGLASVLDRDHLLNTAVEGHALALRGEPDFLVGLCLVAAQLPGDVHCAEVVMLVLDLFAWDRIANSLHP